MWIHTGVDGDVLAAHALRYGVTVAPGSTASRSPRARSFLRLCFDRPALELDAAFERLARAYEDARGRRAVRRSTPEIDAIC